MIRGDRGVGSRRPVREVVGEGGGRSPETEVLRVGAVAYSNSRYSAELVKNLSQWSVRSFQCPCFTVLA
jgi:hypothetical protein